jgi:glycogen synthase
MKILMLGWELQPHNSGGLGVACYQLCKTLSSKGVDIEFVVPYTAAHDIDFMKVTAAHPQDVSAVIAGSTAYDSYKYVYQDGDEANVDIYGQQKGYEDAVARLVEAIPFDIIHAHDWLTFRAALRAKENSGRPFVAHVHSIERDRAGGNIGNPLVREIEEMALLMADRIIAVSRHTKDAIIDDYAVPANKICVAHNSLDVSDIVPLDTENAYTYISSCKKRGYKVVTNIGRLTIQKGLPNLLYAAREVLRREPKTLFLIVGAGEQYEELIEIAADLGISRNVVFAGFQRGKNWRDSFAVADLFVMPSISEPFGLTPLEAGGYGTPSIISKQSGVAEVLRSCLTIDYWDVKGMANQIVNVLRSEPLRDTLSNNVTAEFQRLSWHKTAETLLDLYKSPQVEAVI